ncbi:MAG: nucleoside triphosphate pyrophosphohydrolase, partial [Paracoccaceae bacterium]
QESLSPEQVAEEFGDLLFVMANLGRHLGVEPESALRAANEKFTRRFNYIENELQADGRSADQSNLEEMEALWQEAKTKGL